ncbi:MAG: diguanylate cyclase [Polyangiaceae bacterium]|nr:diguanylate cyclase [Polyangiaceae bacterium]
MFFKRTPSSNATPRAEASGSTSGAHVAVRHGAPEPSRADEALDVLAAVVRAEGTLAVDTEDSPALELAARCQEWARWVLVGPTRGADDDRSWAGLRSFLLDHRRTQMRSLLGTLTDMRRAVHAIATVVVRVLASDERSDVMVRGRLGSVAAALESDDLSEIRRTTAMLVDVVQAALHEREARRVSDLSGLRQSLAGVRTELARAREEAGTDAETQLFDRKCLDETLTRLASLAPVLGTRPAVVIVGVEGLRAAREQHGAEAQGELLRMAARAVLRTFLRREDVVCRYGPEEVAVLVDDCPESALRDLAERARRAVEVARVSWKGQELGLTAGVGAAALAPGEPAETWLARSEDAMHRARQRGPNRTVLATSPPSTGVSLGLA